MRECIFAWTQPGSASYPPFFNFTADGDKIELIVRDHAGMVQHENGAYLEEGHQTTLSVPRSEIDKLAVALFRWLFYKARTEDHLCNKVMVVDGDGARIEIADNSGNDRFTTPASAESPEPREWR